MGVGIAFLYDPVKVEANGYVGLFSTLLPVISMTVQTIIETKLAEQLAPTLITVENDSHKHSRGENSHFNLTLVSEQFAGLRPVQRHQKVYGLLSDELTNGVHALAIHAYTPDEWQSRSEDIPPSPNCLGGSKHDL